MYKFHFVSYCLTMMMMMMMVMR